MSIDETINQSNQKQDYSSRNGTFLISLFLASTLVGTGVFVKYDLGGRLLAFISHQTYEELRERTKLADERIQEETINNFFTKCDINQDGYVDREEYAKCNSY